MKHPFENHSDGEPRWRRPAADRKGPHNVTFIPSPGRCRFVAWDSNPVRGPKVRFNGWTYETVLILILPILTVLSAFVALLFVALQSWIGDALARRVVIAIVLAVLFGNAFRLLRRPRRGRSPLTPHALSGPHPTGSEARGGPRAAWWPRSS